MKSANLCKFLTYLLIFNPLIISCSKPRLSAKNILCKNDSFTCLDVKRNLEVITNKGSFYIEIDGRFSPVTAGNFISLVNPGPIDD